MLSLLIGIASFIAGAAIERKFGTSVAAKVAAEVKSIKSDLSVLVARAKADSAKVAALPVDVVRDSVQELAEVAAGVASEVK